MDAIKILDAGLLTTVQDLGRYGYQRYGVSPSGVMDEFSAKIANRLVGNNEEKAVLETTLKGVSIEFLEDSLVSVTGGESDVTLDGEKIKLWRSYKVKKGQILKMGFCKNGLRNYVAFSGGIDVAIVMNSRATNLKAKLGGYEGRKLMVGDVLKVGEGKTTKLKTLKDNLIPKYGKEIEVKVILGQQEDHFTTDGIKTFFEEEYKITQDSDRMGMRLESESGKKIEHKEGGDIISDGITFGAIQVPGSGQPIVMMADRQTTGGYTKIGNVVSADLSKLAQGAPGSKVKFIECTLEEGIKLLKNVKELIEKEDSYEEVIETPIIENNIANPSKESTIIKEEVVENGWKPEDKIKKYHVTINGKMFELVLERVDI